MRNVFRTEPVRADAAGMLVLALLCSSACAMYKLRHKYVSSSPAIACSPLWCRSSTVVSVTYLDDLILSSVGAPATMLGTSTVCCETSVEVVGT